MQLLTKKQKAAELAVSIRTIELLAAAGKLTVHRLTGPNGHPRFVAGELVSHRERKRRIKQTTAKPKKDWFGTQKGKP